MFSPSNILASPFIQGLIVLFLTILTLFIFRHKSYETLIYAGALWTLLFMFINPFFAVKNENFWIYQAKSLLVLVILFFASAGLTEIFKNIFKSQGSGEAQMIYLAIMYYPVSVLFAFLVRIIIFK